MTVQVLLADDQELVRAGFKLLIDSDPELAVVGEAEDGAQAVELARATHPDVVLMDIRMPRVDGIEATSMIVDDPGLAGVKVLVLTTFGHDEHVFAALRAGAGGFLLKDTPPTELLNAVKVVAQGDSLLSPKVTRQLIEAFVSRPDQRVDPPDLTMLTDREREVLTLVGRGLTNAEIARDLVLSPLTAKTHVSRILTKLGARDRAQLVVIAYESGLVRAQS
ncbi:response regulator transcription factor [Streptomyces sp. NPDC051776]|uniref:response regulator transcription factor n=1 Tax=Streptomyces sp. NPDC051776 TaxID=3155414 RepID=UPI003439FC99